MAKSRGVICLAAKPSHFITAFFCTATFLGGIMHFGLVLDFSDLLILGMALPNILVLYLLRSRIKQEMNSYMQRFEL